jgi:glycolate dehydrogenase FAD-binding subunit
VNDVITPKDVKSVEQTVQWALAEGKTLEIVGSGSKQAIGRPTQTDVTLGLHALAGVTLYEPDELVLSARAGTPLAEIETLLAANSQQLAFEPMDCGPILGGAAGGGTIGGTLASNFSGPRRLKAGAARDHLLGFQAVSGRGEAFKSGGRVVKNVTGYDLSKLMVGSWGTLAVLTDVTLKTLPRPETEETVLLRGLDPGRAVAAMGAAMASPGDVSGAAHLPAKVAALMPGDELPGAGAAVTALRLEGFAASLPQRKSMLEVLLRSFGEVSTIEAVASRQLWQAVRDVIPFAANGNEVEPPLWRISIAPSCGADLAGSIADEAGGQMMFDWAGGLVWLRLEPSADAGAALVRRLVAPLGGHATLVRSATSVRAAVDVFPTQDTALFALTKRVKESFDPKGVLNPGRMWAGV